MKQKKAKKKSSKASTLFLIFFVVAGLSLLLYPSVANYVNSLHSSRAITSYNDALAQLGDDAQQAMLDEAHAYNKKLFDDGYTLILPEPRKPSYFKLLDITGTGIMGYIEIQKLGVMLPIYHGTAEEVLQIAVGHIEGSFLPVGGENTHTVLSGHRGLPSAKLFTDLDKMTIGDTFTIKVLKEELTYEVDQILTVLPDEMDALNVVPGEDLCTLITCTPYGINTHRMLVRGRRIDNIEEARVIIVPPGAFRIPNYIAIPAIGIPLLFLFLLGLTVYSHFKRPKRSIDELEQMLRKDREKDDEDEEEETEEEDKE